MYFFENRENHSNALYVEVEIGTYLLVKQFNWMYQEP